MFFEHKQKDKEKRYTADIPWYLWSSKAHKLTHYGTIKKSWRMRIRRIFFFVKWRNFVSQGKNWKLLFLDRLEHTNERNKWIFLCFSHNFYTSMIKDLQQQWFCLFVFLLLKIFVFKNKIFLHFTQLITFLKTIQSSEFNINSFF